jgi:thiol-disulfide isomerase/thioredoxin
MELRPAPEWQTTTWLNTAEPLNLERLRGRVVLLHAFQMLCPGCVAHGLPQAQRVAELFKGAPLTVIGLHTVFEHHEAMGLQSLRAFLLEYRIRIPVGVDVPGLDGDPMPRTMRAYAMQGTPTTAIIDAHGRLRRQVFGVYDDLLLGAELGALLVEAERSAEAMATSSPPATDDCADGTCTIA